MPAGHDRDIYVPRPLLEGALSNALVAERNVLLVGERRSGKTSLLRKAAADLERRLTFVTVEGALAGTPADLLRLIARALGAPAPESGSARPDGGARDAFQLLDEIDRIPRRPGVVVVVEGPLDAEVAYTVFGRLREQLWALPYTWVATAEPNHVGPLRTPPADAFWSFVLEVTPFEDKEIDELLYRALDEDERMRIEAAPDRPTRAPAGHVVRWAQDVLDGVGLPARQREQELEQEAAQLGRQATMVLEELKALGRPAAAGDPEFLARLGWTRANTARWLSRMEDAGIVRSIVGKPQGAGRPPKLYEAAT